MRPSKNQKSSFPSLSNNSLTQKSEKEDNQVINFKFKPQQKSSLQLLEELAEA